MADTTLNEVHAQTVREIADELHGQLHAFADAVAAGDVDEQMTVDVFQALAELHPAVEDAAATADAIDDESDRFRAMDEARRTVHHLATERDSPAVMAASSAADYAELAKQR
jgi:hypothetical protein